MLQWRLEHGDRLTQYREYEALTGVTPADLLDAPGFDALELLLPGGVLEIADPWQAAAWNAFNDLSGSRPITMGGAGAIPYGEIRAWLDEQGVADPDDRADLRRLVKALDNTYLAWLAKDRSECLTKKQSASPSAPTAPRRKNR